MATNIVMKSNTFEMQKPRMSFEGTTLFSNVNDFDDTHLYKFVRIFQDLTLPLPNTLPNYTTDFIGAYFWLHNDHIETIDISIDTGGASGAIFGNQKLRPTATALFYITSSTRYQSVGAI